MSSSFPCGDTHREDSFITMDGISVRVSTVHSSRSKNLIIVYLTCLYLFLVLSVQTEEFEGKQAS